ncbi:MAG: hypothetical protein HY711_01455 [Candidatus Melainabacteria bacterium]|nr:hypothetical protein [Candidatus Melainabacteria bacterium]
MRKYWVECTGKELLVRADSPRQALDIVRNQLSLKAFGRPTRHDFSSVSIAWVSQCPELSLPGIVEELVGLGTLDLLMHGVREDALFDQKLTLSKALVERFERGKVNFLVLDAEREVPYCGERDGVFESPVSRELIEEFRNKFVPSALERLIGKETAQFESHTVRLGNGPSCRATIRRYIVATNTRMFSLLAVAPRQALDIVRHQLSLRAFGRPSRIDLSTLSEGCAFQSLEMSLGAIVSKVTGLGAAELEALRIVEDRLYAQRLNIDKQTVAAFSLGNLNFLVMDEGRHQTFCGERNGTFEVPVSPELVELFADKIKKCRAQQQEHQKLGSSGGDESGGILACV